MFLGVQCDILQVPFHVRSSFAWCTMFVILSAVCIYNVHSSSHNVSSVYMYVCRSYPVIDHSSQEALTIVSPTHRPSKRIKVESSPRYADRNGR